MKGVPQMGHSAGRFAGKTREEQQKFFLNTGDSRKFAHKLCCDFPALVNIWVLFYVNMNTNK